MSSDDNKALVRRWIAEVFDKANADVFRELADVNYVYRRPGYEDLSGNQILELQRTMISAVPDLHNTIESQIAEGDTVVTHVTTHGTHRNALGDWAPTGNRIETECVLFTRLENGQVVEDREIFDSHTLLTQLGAVRSS